MAIPDATDYELLNEINDKDRREVEGDALRVQEDAQAEEQFWAEEKAQKFRDEQEAGSEIAQQWHDYRESIRGCQP